MSLNRFNANEAFVIERRPRSRRPFLSLYRAALNTIDQLPSPSTAVDMLRLDRRAFL